jgi:hypothetical protein
MVKNQYDFGKIIEIPTMEIGFDPKNPRFFRLNGKVSDEKVIEEMLDDEGVQDLMSSIGQQGYFPGEPILLTPNENGKLFVVEGNRRLAALKLLNGELLPPARKKSSVGNLIKEAQHVPIDVSAIIYETREEILRYLGYRHITGIKEWEPLAKAKYLSEMKDSFYKGVEKSEQLSILAKEIGSKPYIVGTLLCGLALYDYAINNSILEKIGISPERIDFSYITTSIGYKNISDWIGLADRTDTSLNQLNPENLKNLMYWMFVPQRNGKTILRETRRLGMLAEVVASSEGLSYLLDNGSLDEAFLFTAGPQQALSNAMVDANNKLKIVWESLLKSSPTEEHRILASDIHQFSKKIVDAVQQSLEPKE